MKMTQHYLPAHRAITGDVGAYYCITCNFHLRPIDDEKIRAPCMQNRLSLHR
jgi:hypothetical protein